MGNLNKVLLMGRLTRNVELRYIPSGSAVGEFGLAINRKFTLGNGQKKDETTFVDIVVWGRQAETSDQYLSKGSSVFIEGRLNFETWEDKNTGQRRSKINVVAERVQFMGSAGDNSKPSNTGQHSPTSNFSSDAPDNMDQSKQAREENIAKFNSSTESNNNYDIEGDDIPF